MRERFAWYCILYGGIAAGSGLIWAMQVYSPLNLSYLLASLIPLGAALIGWQCLKSQMQKDELITFYIFIVLLLALLSESFYFGAEVTTSWSLWGNQETTLYKPELLSSSVSSGVHLARNFLLDLWLPYLFLLWLRQPLAEQLTPFWRRALGGYMVIWGLVALSFGLMASPPMYMQIAPLSQVARPVWVLLTIALYGVIIVIGVRLWLHRGIAGWLWGAIGLSLILLMFADWLWIAWLLGTARSPGTASWNWQQVGYLAGGLNDVLYSLAPLILLAVLYSDELMVIAWRQRRGAHG